VLLDQLVVLYQPVVDLRTGAVVAAEALVRLRDQTTGALLAPARFLPAAERSGQVTEIDRRVAEIAVGQLGRWRTAHPGRELTIGVNVSVRDLDDLTLPARVAALAARSGVPCEAIIIELTETLASPEGRGHEAVLEQLVALGCTVTLDDFGTGFSSLSHLQRFPVGGIKVDRSFTSRLGEGSRNDRVVRSMVQLGLDLRVHVTAEGVESVAQLRLLQEMGCPYGQGYLFSRPVPAGELGDLLQRSFPVRLQQVSAAS
jgi:EAL domain-containing protein (putative c-di-GMP-specific phosphodiesterase class I)